MTQLTDFVQHSLEDLKAEDIQILPVKELTSVTDYMVLACGNSNQHVRSIAEHLRTQAKHGGHDILGCEGIDGGEWALLDLGDAIIHVMLPAVRDYYQLAKMWTVESVDSTASGDMTE